MLISLEGKLLASSLIPKSLMKGLETEEKEKQLGEKAMCAIVVLIVQIALGAIKALRQGHYKNLDANPGDGGCQDRMLELRRLSAMDLKEECSQLEKAAEEIKKLVNKRKSSPSERQKSSCREFFQKQMGSLTISKEMEYILHCYLSTVLRTPYQKLSNGVVLTKSEFSKLSILSGNITVLDTLSRRKIMEENQKTLSMLSVEAIHFSATQVSSLELEEKILMVKMLSPEHTRLFTPDPQYEPKAFGCLFYKVKTVLVRLREEQAIVCLKKIVTTEQPFHLLLQPKTPGGEFEVLPDESCTLLSPSTLVAVFEAVINVEKEEAAKLLSEHGFTTTILTQAAKEAPYEPKSSLKDVTEPKAVEEISQYKEKGMKIGDFVMLDHVYLNALSLELKK